MRTFRTILLTLAFLGTSCVAPEESRQLPRSQIAILKTTLATLNTKAPLQDLRANRSNGDNRLIGINGFVCFPPGLNDQQVELYTRQIPRNTTFGIRCLEGTSDAIEGKEHAGLIEKAVTYAKIYNQAIIQELLNENAL